MKLQDVTSFIELQHETYLMDLQDGSLFMELQDLTFSDLNEKRINMFIGLHQVY
jgi:hypothetical protein